MKPVCIISCPIDTFSGYGHRSRDFVNSLIKIKDNEWDIKILPQVWGTTPWGFLSKDNPLRKRFINNLTSKPDIWVQITIPSEFEPVGKFNIGVTAGIESTVPPPNFIEGCNKMDLNLISSNFSKEVFQGITITQNNTQGQPVKQIKLTRPMQVLLEGLDTDVYFRKPKDSDLLKGIKENFCFLFTGHWLPGDFGEDRKNVGNLIETFYKTFNTKGIKPALLLKCNKVDYSLLDKEDVLSCIRDVKDKFKNKENLPNIYLLHGEFSNEQLNQLNNDPKVKAFISFTKGEGFGRPLLEQAVTGKPVITSNWSGHTDFIRPEYNVLIGGELKEIHPSAANDFLIKQAKWFNLDLEVASKAMKDVFKNYKKYKTQSLNQTKFLTQNFGIDKMTKDLEKYLEQITVTEQVPLQLPKLKKLGSKKDNISLPKLPKLEKING